MKPVISLLPEHDGLRRTVQWLATQRPWDAKIIEEACRRFDLWPIDEEFLLRRFCEAEHGTGDPMVQQPHSSSCAKTASRGRP